MAGNILTVLPLICDFPLLLYIIIVTETLRQYNIVEMRKLSCSSYYKFRGDNLHIYYRAQGLLHYNYCEESAGLSPL